MMTGRSYSRMIELPTFEERFEYLRCDGIVGEQTFGYERYLNQLLYHSDEWHSLRNEIILRDDGCDLADPDYSIKGRIYIHHINPITIDNIRNRDACVLDPENLVCVSFNTHNAIHYGPNSLADRKVIERVPGDTCLWK